MSARSKGKRKPDTLDEFIAALEADPELRVFVVQSHQVDKAHGRRCHWIGTAFVPGCDGAFMSGRPESCECDRLQTLLDRQGQELHEARRRAKANDELPEQVAKLQRLFTKAVLRANRLERENRKLKGEPDPYTPRPRAKSHAAALDALMVDLDAKEAP